jgi:hypothetical protein
MHAFIKGKMVETENTVYRFSSESRAREFLRRAYAEGEVSASGKVEPLGKEEKSHVAPCQFLRVQKQVRKVPQIH